MPAARRSTALAFLTALVVVAYAPHLGNEFVFDDTIFMRNDPRLRSLDQAMRLFVEPLWGFTDDGGRSYAHQYYRPLQTFPLALSRAAFGEAAWPSHVLNLTVHWLNVVMVFFFILRVMGGSRDRGTEGSSVHPDSIPRSLDPSIPSAAAAALFAVHPSYNEAVFWVSNIAGLGVAACTLAILLVHASEVGRRFGAQVLAGGLFLAALWFKESGVLVPVLMALYDLLLAPDRGWRRLLRLWPRYLVLALVFAGYTWLRLYALGGALPGFETVPLTSFELVINAVALLPQYVATFLWPVDLNMYHDFDAIRSIGTWSFAAGLTILLVACVLLLRCWRRRPVISFALAWMLVTVSPHLLARWPQLNVFAERYLYLPSVGVFLLITYGMMCFPAVARARVVGWTIAVVLLVSVVIDIRRGRDWHDEVTLYAKTLTQSRRAELIRINLGLRYYELGRYDDGIAVLNELIAFDPSWHDAWHNLGLLYLATNRDRDAVHAFEQARDRDGASVETLLNLGVVYDRQGRRDEALAAYFAALRLQPDNSKVWFNLAGIAVELGQRENAGEAIERILLSNPGDAEAVALRQRIAAMPPSVAPRSDETQRRCADAKRAVDEERYQEAIVTLRVASWYDERSPLPHQYLANVYYLVGRLPLAIEHQRAALARAPDNDLYRRNLASLESALPR